MAKTSRIPDYPQDTVKDLEHVRLLADQFDAYLTGLREKHTWFLRATLGE